MKKTKKIQLNKNHLIEVIEISEDLYFVKFYEFYKKIGWKFLGNNGYYSKDCLEYEYEIKL